MRSPDDTSAIEAAIARGEIDPAGIVAILGKTEGNGCVNDFTRGFAVQSLRLLLGRWLDPVQLERICLVMSGGTEGAIAPHWLVLEAIESGASAEPALALGRHVTRPLEPHEIGRMAQVETVAAGVRQAMREAAIDTAEAVHLVQIKCPLLTAERVADALAQGRDVATGDTLRSMGLSRGASALGVALALGEVDAATLSDAGIGRDLGHFSGRASCSAGVELMTCEIVVLGMSSAWSGPLRIDHAVMADAIDIDPVRAMLRRLGATFDGQLDAAERKRVVGVVAKAEASKSGRLRGHRHTMLDDSDISSTRHARGFVAGALAALIGHAELFVSGGAEHQGPDGGGPCAIIYRD